MKQITDSIWLIPESAGGMLPDCNMYVIGSKEEFYLIDTGNGMHSQDKVKALVEDGFSLENCKAIILTHIHFDHSHGIKDFNIPVFLHESAVEEIEKENLKPIIGNTALEVMAKGAGLKMPPFKIKKKLVDGDTLNLAGTNWKVIHTPGHAQEAICLWQEEKRILISGDTLFENSIGRTDLYSSDNEKMLESLKKLDALGILLLLPGHGGVLKEAATVVHDIVEHFSRVLIP